MWFHFVSILSLDLNRHVICYAFMMKCAPYRCTHLMRKLIHIESWIRALSSMPYRWHMFGNVRVVFCHSSFFHSLLSFSIELCGCRFEFAITHRAHIYRMLNRSGGESFEESKISLYTFILFYFFFFFISVYVISRSQFANCMETAMRVQCIIVAIARLSSYTHTGPTDLITYCVTQQHHRTTTPCVCTFFREYAWGSEKFVLSTHTMPHIILTLAMCAWPFAVCECEWALFLSFLSHFFHCDAVARAHMHTMCKRERAGECARAHAHTLDRLNSTRVLAKSPYVPGLSKSSFRFSHSLTVSRVRARTRSLSLNMC